MQSLCPTLDHPPGLRAEVVKGQEHPPEPWTMHGAQAGAFPLAGSGGSARVCVLLRLFGGEIRGEAKSRVGANTIKGLERPGGAVGMFLSAAGRRQFQS